MSICIVDSDIGSVRPIEPWALAQHTRRLSPGREPALGAGRLGTMCLASIMVLGPWPNPKTRILEFWNFGIIVWDLPRARVVFSHFPGRLFLEPKIATDVSCPVPLPLPLPLPLPSSPPPSIPFSRSPPRPCSDVCMFVHTYLRKCIYVPLYIPNHNFQCPNP